MKNRLNWIMAAAFGLMSVTAFAQTAPAQAKDCCHKATKETCTKAEGRKHKGQAGNREERFKELETQLQLSSLQSSQLKTLHEARSNQMKALKENSALSKEEKRTQMKAMHQQHKTELQKILSEEQYAKLQDMRQEKMQERKARGGKKGTERSGK